MKTTMTKMMLLAALVGAATVSANAGVRFNVDLVVPTPVVVAPVLPPAPAPMVEVVPVCPGVGYVWAPGYWAFRDHAYVWVRGAWNYRPVGWHDDRGRDYGHDRGHDADRGRDYDRDHGFGGRR